ncbi:primosomal protein N' [Marispirochaeta aestuarii]|uniref:replication restart helicase PriA n=1 Tax=Marispirochaeta aestuarii TaxID=1963862 RepID=UPI0029C6B034|nr:primosomal protein N' [Marispirochaeta aestuarii]
MFAEVALNLPLNKTFTYRLPDDMNAGPGYRVEVDFRRRKVVAFVLSVSPDPPSGDFTLKDILRVLDNEPVFGESEADLARWTARRYFSSVGEVLSSMLPGGKKESSMPSILPEDDVPLSEFTLSDEQQDAVQAILDPDTRPIYLYGITGSGKTAVFFSAATEVLKRGGGVIYLVPEISLTHQIVREAVSRFGNIVSVWHSRITPSQRLTEWRRIRSGEARLVIGARSAVFAPVARLGLIILDEEHEGSYKSGSSPRYHARQIAMYRTKKDAASLVMGSATPSVEASYLMEQGQLRTLHLTRRLAGGAPPQMKILDMRGEKGVISDELAAGLKRTLADKRQAILFLNRRGFSYFFHCRSCGYEMRCEHCSVSLTFHKSRGIMLCHYCGYQSRPVQVCPECGSLDVGYSGYGTEGIEEEIAALFPDARIARVDTDSVSRKGSLRKILGDFRQGKLDILLGTQMVAKGLNFPGVRLVGIVMADTTLMLPDFRAAERTFALLTQVAGRAGRFNPDGEVLIQTFHGQAPAIRLAAESRQEDFYEEELSVRRSLGFPPFARLIRILFRGKSRDKVLAASRQFCTALERDLPRGIDLLGPSEAPLAVISGNYRIHAILRGEEFPVLYDFCSFFLERIDPPSGVYREVDVDPVSLL